MRLPEDRRGRFEALAPYLSPEHALELRWQLMDRDHLLSSYKFDASDRSPRMLLNELFLFNLLYGQVGRILMGGGSADLLPDTWDTEPGEWRLGKI